MTVRVAPIIVSPSGRFLLVRWKSAGSASLAFLLVVAVSIGLAVAPGAPASALSVPDLPIISQLASLVNGAAPGPSLARARTQIVQSSSSAASFMRKLATQRAAVAAGTATVEETAAVATAAGRFAPLATRFAGLAAGPGAVAVTGLELGLQIGSTGSRLLGFNDSMVCSQENGILTAVSAVTNGVDCTAYNNALAEAERNFDQLAKQAPATECLLGSCATFNSNIRDGNFQNFKLCWSYVAADGYQVRVAANTVPTGNFGGIGGDPTNANGCPGAAFAMWSTVATDVVTDWTLSVWKNGVQVGTKTHITDPSEIVRADPDRQFQCKVTNTDGTTATKFSDKPFKESQDVLGAIPQCPQSDSSKIPSRVEIGESTDGNVKPLYDLGVTDAYKSARSLYPLCADGACAVELTPTATPTVTCHDNPVPCADWFTSPTKLQDFKCTYGTYDVPLSECTSYAPTFQPEAPSTGETIGDPSTGDTTGPTSASIDGAPGPRLDADGKCFPTGWAVFNPVAWVLLPVECAIEWAFVPSQDAVQSFSGDISTAVDDTAVGTVGTAVRSVGAAFAAGSTGCDGPAFTVDMTLPGGRVNEVYHPLAACTGTMASLAVTVRTAGAVFVWIFALLAILRYLAAIFGFVGFSQARPDPTSGVKFKGGDGS